MRHGGARLLLLAMSAPGILASPTTAPSALTLTLGPTSCPHPCVCRNSSAHCSGLPQLSPQSGPGLVSLEVETCDWSDQSGGLHLLTGLQDLLLANCHNVSAVFDDFKQFASLKKLNVVNSSEVHLDCAALVNLKHLRIANSSLRSLQGLFAECETQKMPLRSLDLSGNMFVNFDWSLLEMFPTLEQLNLSNNQQLERILVGRSSFPHLHSLDLHSNPSLAVVCNNLLAGLPGLHSLDMRGSGVETVPTLLFSLPRLHTLLINNSTPPCNCQLAFLVRQNSSQRINAQLGEMRCRLPGPGRPHLVSVLDPALPSLLHCTPATISESMANTTLSVGTAGVRLDCSATGLPAPARLWLTPRYELLRYRPDTEPQCDPVEDEILLSDTIRDYSKGAH